MRPTLSYCTGQGWFTLPGPDPNQQSIITLEHSRALIQEHSLETIYEPADLVTTDAKFPNILVPGNPLKPCYSLPRQVKNRWYPVQTLDMRTRQNGYPRIGFTFQNHTYYRYTHILRYRNHIGPIPPELTINHWDGNELNSSLTNLHLLSLQENMIHRQLTGYCKPSPSEYKGSLGMGLSSPGLRSGRNKPTSQDPTTKTP
jgi:hypothetical protein